MTLPERLSNQIPLLPNQSESKTTHARHLIRTLDYNRSHLNPYLYHAYEKSAFIRFSKTYTFKQYSNKGAR